MPDKRIPKKSAKEFPILYSRRPFCLASAADFNLDHLKTALVDENLALDLNLPIHNLQYQRFSLNEDKTVWSRLTGTLKLTAQVLENGRAGQSFQLKAKVIRNLFKITGAEAVCDALLEEKLLSLPVAQEKPEKKVKKWLKSNDRKVPSKVAPSLDLKSERDQSVWPPSTATPFYSKCRCGWSEASTRGTACCQHKGSCQHCIDNLADVATEVDNFSEGPPENSREDVAIKFSEGHPNYTREEMNTNIDDEVKCYNEDGVLVSVILPKNKYDTNDDQIKSEESPDGIREDLDTDVTGDRYVPYNGNVNLVMVNSPTTLGLNNNSDTDEDDFVVHRMTGDRLREYHAKHRSTTISREESKLRELDMLNRYHKLKFPGQPCIAQNYGDLDVYLKRQTEGLRALKEGLDDHLKEESDDANLHSDHARLHWPHQPIRRPMTSRDQYGPMRSLGLSQRPRDILPILYS